MKEQCSECQCRHEEGKCLSPNGTGVFQDCMTTEEKLLEIWDSGEGRQEEAEREPQSRMSRTLGGWKTWAKGCVLEQQTIHADPI